MDPDSEKDWFLGVTLTQAAVNEYMKREMLPGHDAKYERLRATQWCQINEPFKKCCRFKPNARSSATQLLSFLESEPVSLENQQENLPCVTKGNFVIHVNA